MFGVNRFMNPMIGSTPGGMNYGGGAPVYDPRQVQGTDTPSGYSHYSLPAYPSYSAYQPNFNTFFNPQQMLQAGAPSFTNPLWYGASAGAVQPQQMPQASQGQGGGGGFGGLSPYAAFMLDSAMSGRSGSAPWQNMFKSSSKARDWVNTLLGG